MLFLYMNLEVLGMARSTTQFFSLFYFKTKKLGMLKHVDPFSFFVLFLSLSPLAVQSEQIFTSAVSFDR